jgi:hypothetical protein
VEGLCHCVRHSEQIIVKITIANLQNTVIVSVTKYFLYLNSDSRLLKFKSVIVAVTVQIASGSGVYTAAGRIQLGTKAEGQSGRRVKDCKTCLA